MYGATWPELRIDPVSALVWPSTEFIGKPNQRNNKQQQIQGHIKAPSYSWPYFLGGVFWEQSLAEDVMAALAPQCVNFTINGKSRQKPRDAERRPAS